MMVALKDLAGKDFGGKNVAHLLRQRNTPFKCPSCQGMLRYLCTNLTLKCLECCEVIIEDN